MKTKVDKKINRLVKKINKDLAADVFGNRFWLRQYRKTKTNDGFQYYLYELCDREQPERNQLIPEWIWGEGIFTASNLYLPLNDFIVSSDFWSKKNI